MVNGLICQFCGQDGFDTRKALERHIASHAGTEKRGCPKCGSKSWDAWTEQCDQCGVVNPAYPE